MYEHLACSNPSGEIARNRLRREIRLLRTRNIRAAFSDSVPIHAVNSDEDSMKEEDKEIAGKRRSGLISEREGAEEEGRNRNGSRSSAASENEDGPNSRVVDLDSSASFESETESSKASTSDSDQGGQPKSTQWHGFFKLLKKKSAITGLHFNTIPTINVPKLTRKKSKKALEATAPADCSVEGGFGYLKSSWKNFSLAELQAATNNFSPENLIGEGGYSEVYKGQIEDGEQVAIKRLSGEMSEEMTADFLSELGIIVHVNHPNIAKLVGYGVEGGMHIVLELSPNGSLSSLLCGAKEKLNWGVRYKIAVGTSEGLFYLHEGCQRRIIHKDIKAANILLTEDFEPQISDFGLAKWLPEQWTHHVVSKIEGTFGYLPPEFFMHGIVDEKTDVYSFGVLLLELITGRMALDKSQKSLVLWAKPLIARNSIDELVDPSLSGTYDVEQMKRMILTASLCIHESPADRPQMKDVSTILRGDQESEQLVKQYQEQSLASQFDTDDSNEYDLSRRQMTCIEN
uniref:non-specific serine/threonine protein kinase n=1 Tax=Kalanchoe fedtschenkoi TaxID=63787 RepID=A0A7N0T2G1_KALFE